LMQGWALFKFIYDAYRVGVRVDWIASARWGEKSMEPRRSQTFCITILVLSLRIPSKVMSTRSSESTRNFAKGHSKGILDR
jgi:hypothetical protein